MSAGFEELAESWWSWIASTSWQGGLVALLLVGCARWGRGRWPAPLCYALLVVGLLKFALPPVWPAPTGAFTHLAPPSNAGASAPVWSALPAPGPSESAELALESELAQLASQLDVQPAPAADAPAAVESAPARSASQAASPISRASWKSLLFGVYLLGALSVLGGAWVRSRRTRALLTDARPDQGRLELLVASLAERIGVRRTPELLVGERVPGPLAFGWLRPRIALPRTLVERADERELEAVLAHELAHHARRDPLAAWFELALLAAWWFHPALWFTLGALREAREDCCDELALERGGATPDDYGRALLTSARVAGERARSPLALALGGTKQRLAARLRRLFREDRSRATRLSASAWLALALTGGVLLPGLRAQAADDDAPEGALRIAVLNAEGEALEGASLQVRLNETQFGLSVGGDGQAWIELPEDLRQLQVRARAAGYLEWESSWVWSAGEGQRSLAELEQELEIALRRAGLLRGVVVDSAGRPVAGARVRLRSETGAHYDRSTESDAEGRYRFEPIPRGEYVVLEAEHEAVGRTEVSALHLGGEIVQAELVLAGEERSSEPELEPELDAATERAYEAARRAAFEAWSEHFGRAQLDEPHRDLRVLHANGEPAVGARAVATRHGEPVGLRNGELVHPEGAPVREVDAGGRLEIALAGASGLLVVHERGWAVWEAAVLNDDDTVVLEPWARVEGRVLRGSRPVADAPLAGNVAVPSSIWDRVGALPPSIRTRTDAEGAFVLERVAGRATLFVCAESVDGHLRSVASQTFFLRMGGMHGIVLGGEGEQVQLHFTEFGSEEDLAAALARPASTLTREPLAGPQPPATELDPEMRRAWRDALVRSDRSIEWLESLGCSRGLRLLPGARLEAVDLLPGRWTLRLAMEDGRFVEREIQIGAGEAGGSSGR